MYTENISQLTAADYTGRAVRLLEQAQDGYGGQADSTRVAAAAVYAQLAATTQAREQAEAREQTEAREQAEADNA